MLVNVSCIFIGNVFLEPMRIQQMNGMRRFKTD